jgi:hypothetical protein
VLDLHISFGIFWICMLKYLQLHSIHFLITKQTISHSCYSGLICQFLILSKRSTTTLTRDQFVSTVNYVYVWFCSNINPPLYADVQFTRRNRCSQVTKYLEDSDKDNFYVNYVYVLFCSNINPPLYADVQFTRRNHCSQITKYLQDSDKDNFVCKLCLCIILL